MKIKEKSRAMHPNTRLTASGWAAGETGRRAYTQQLVQCFTRSRKAQFYLFTAILLIAYATLLLNAQDVVPETSSNFKSAYENFRFESARVINNALFEQVSVFPEYQRFAKNFISYSKMKKLNIEIFSVLETGERVYFDNQMENEVHILNINETIPGGSSTYFLRSNFSEAVLEVRDDVFHENIYKFSISDEGTDLKAVLRVRKGSKREIFVLE